MVAALIGDLLILPATVMFLRKVFRGLRERFAGASPAA
jgi:hypothetical protein